MLLGADSVVEPTPEEKRKTRPVESLCRFSSSWLDRGILIDLGKQATGTKSSSPSLVFQKKKHSRQQGKK